jgi:hypothetical protein
MSTLTQTTITFPFYLDAWCYVRKHAIKKYTIKKTGLREMTLTFTPRKISTPKVK